MSFHFNHRLVPTDEQRNALELERLLYSLESYACQFDAALALFDFSLAQEQQPKNRLFRDWQFLAARDGAITLFNFYKTIGGLHETLKLCPTLQPLVDGGVLRAASKRFKDQFPRPEKVRHGVAHEAEFARNPEEHAFTGDASKFGISLGNAFLMMQNNLMGRNYVTTVEGHIVTYELSAVSQGILRAVVSDCTTAFSKVGRL